MLLFLSVGRYWIGLRGPPNCRGIQCHSQWYWDDGTPMTYMNWKPDKPHGGERGCGLMNYDGQWDTSSCASDIGLLVNGFICKGMI